MTDMEILEDVERDIANALDLLDGLNRHTMATKLAFTFLTIAGIFAKMSLDREEDEGA